MNTEIICIMDRSGSMAAMQLEAQNAFNHFIEEQKKVPGQARCTLVSFDNDYEVVYRAQPLSDVPPYVLIPRGSTALYDAIGQTLHSEAERIHNEGWAELVIVCVTTDGHENASHFYRLDRIREMVTHAEAKGWKFIWQAANINAFILANTLGSMGTMSNSVAQSAAGYASTAAYASVSTTTLRSGGDEQTAAFAATQAAAKAIEATEAKQ